MVSESWGWGCPWDGAEGHGFTDEASALRSEILHYQTGCTDPESGSKMAADRERLAALDVEKAVRDQLEANDG